MLKTYYVKNQLTYRGNNPDSVSDMIRSNVQNYAALFDIAANASWSGMLRENKISRDLLVNCPELAPLVVNDAAFVTEQLASNAAYLNMIAASPHAVAAMPESALFFSYENDAILNTYRSAVTQEILVDALSLLCGQPWNGETLQSLLSNGETMALLANNGFAMKALLSVTVGENAFFAATTDFATAFKSGCLVEHIFANTTLLRSFFTLPGTARTLCFKKISPIRGVRKGVLAGSLKFDTSLTTPATNTLSIMSLGGNSTIAFGPAVGTNIVAPRQAFFIGFFNSGADASNLNLARNSTLIEPSFSSATSFIVKNNTLPNNTNSYAVCSFFNIAQSSGTAFSWNDGNATASMRTVVGYMLD